MLSNLPNRNDNLAQLSNSRQSGEMAVGSARREGRRFCTNFGEQNESAPTGGLVAATEVHDMCGYYGR